MSYIALEKIHLPEVNDQGNVVGKVEKVLGDTITKADLEAAGQTDADVKILLDHGSMCTPGEFKARVDEAEAVKARQASEDGAARHLKDLGFSDGEVAAALGKKGGAA